jgi:hypothetical protein
MIKFSKSFKNLKVFIKSQNVNISIIILKNDKTIIAYHFGPYMDLSCKVLLVSLFNNNCRYFDNIVIVNNPYFLYNKYNKFIPRNLRWKRILLQLKCVKFWSRTYTFFKINLKQVVVFYQRILVYPTLLARDKILISAKPC